MLLPHPLLRHRGHGEPSHPCVSAAAHSPQKTTLEEDYLLQEKAMGQIRIVKKHRTQGGLMKLIIAGSRTFTDYQCLCQVLAPDRHRITQVLTSGARGAELLGYRWAWKHAITHQRFRADWERVGQVAGVRLNHQMAQAGDVLVAFGHTTAPGTAHLIQCMRALGKPVVIIGDAHTTAEVAS